MDGDLEAYGELIACYQVDVWKSVAAILPDRGRAEDLVQEAFIRAYHRLDQFERGRDFGVWIKAIARNLARNEWRHQQRELNRRLDYYADWESDAAESGQTEEEGQRIKAALDHCLRRLPPAAAEAVALRYDQALDFDTIARKLRRTVPATRQLLSRARLWLKDCVERESDRS